MNLFFQRSLVFIFSLSISGAVIAAQPAVSFIEGQDYQRVPAAQFESSNDLTTLQQVANIELFYWYGCAACLQVEQALADYLADKPELSLRRTPLVARVSWRPQAYIQPLFEQLEGRVELPSQTELYQQCIEDCRVFASYEAITDWLLKTYELEELPGVEQRQIWQAEKDYRKRAKTHSISQVPTIIINEQFITDANSAKSPQRLIQIVDYLLSL